MSNRPITAKIDLRKIRDEWIFHANSGAEYLDVVIWPNKNGPGKYGDTHYIAQSVPKHAQGERGEIIGNLKMPDAQPSQQRQQQRPPQQGYRPQQRQRDPDLDPQGGDVPY